MSKDLPLTALPNVKRRRVSQVDSFRFVLRLLLATVLATLGAVLVLSGGWIRPGLGIVVLGAIYTHAVELQHQCLHHSAFVRSWPHRIVGILLGLPTLVSYSHYRVKHLQHHRFLGTARDSEFFGFNVTRRLTWRVLASGLLDYKRLLIVVRDVIRSVRGSWYYPDGQISPRARRQIIQEYRLIGLLLVAAAMLGFAGFVEEVALLWLAPLALAVPIHFLVELPEHVMCDDDTTDVLRNTRSIKGSWLTTWFTNSNNLHIEHHLDMRTPLQRLADRHPDIAARSKYVERSYVGFYRLVLREVRRQ